MFAHYTPACLAIVAVRVHSARRQISFACLYVSQGRQKWVCGASMIKHAHEFEHTVTRLHTTARNGTQLPRASPSLLIITFAHMHRKRNSFWDWSLLWEKRACGRTHESKTKSASQLI